MDILNLIKEYKKNAYKLTREDIQHIKKLVRMINKLAKDKTTLKSKKVTQWINK